jgi:hypothetical protein
VTAVGELTGNSQSRRTFRAPRLLGNQRGVPDISLSAAVDGAVVYYYSFAPSATIDGTCCWDIVAGTSSCTGSARPPTSKGRSARGAA